MLLTVIRFSFRYRSGQAVRILVAFELPESRVLIWREGTQRIIEPVANHPRDLRELLAQWRREGPLGPEDELPEILDRPVRPEDLL